MRNGGRRRRPVPRALPAIAAVAAVVLGLTACGGSSSSTPSSTATSSSVGPENSALTLARQQEGLLYSGSTYQEPIGSAPKPATNKTIWVISVGQAAIFAVEGENALMRAAQHLGWHIKVWDGKFDPNQELAGVRQAVAAHADGIWLWTVDCPPVKAAVQQALAAHIPVVLSQAQECGSGANATSVRYMIGYNDGVVSKTTTPADYKIWNKAFGAAIGWWTIVHTGGHAKAIEFVETDVVSGIAEANGFEDAMRHCSGCSIVEKVSFTGQDLGPALQAKTQQALLQHPEATVVYGNYDTPITSGIAAAVRASGRKMLLLGGEGDPPNIALLRQGVESAGSGYSSPLDGWCAADALIFIFAGQQPRGCGMGVTLYDRQHNLPAVGHAWNTNLPYEAAYLKSWGLQ